MGIRNGLFYSGLCFVIILTNLEITMVNLAVPDIANHFHLSLEKTQAVLSTYLLGALISFLYFGYLTVKYNSIRVLRFALLLFLVGTFFGGFATTVKWLYLGRFLQGLGFAGAFPTTLALIPQSFSKKYTRSVLGATTMLSGITQALGPMIGGIILESLGWSAIFLVKLPIISLTLFFSFLKSHKESTHLQSEQWSWKSWSNLCVFICCIYFSLDVRIIWGKLFLLGLGVVGVIYYFWSKQSSKSNIINPIILSSPLFQVGVILRISSMLYFSQLFFVCSLYFQNILCWNSSNSSKAFLLLTLSYALTSLFYGYFVKKDKKFLNYVFYFKLLSLFFLLIYFEFSANLLLFMGLIFAGMAFGLAMPMSLNISLKNIREEKQGSAMSIFSCLGFLASLVGVIYASIFLEFNSLHFSQNFSFNIADDDILHFAQGIRSIDLLPREMAQKTQVVFEFSVKCIIYTMSILDLLFWMMVQTVQKKPTRELKFLQK